MNIILAVLVGLLLIALGVLYYFYAKKSREHTWLTDDHEQVLEQKDMLEKEIGVLRASNRDALRAWKIERKRLWRDRGDAQLHARELQEFHLNNEYELQHELAGAHALIELLMATFPKEYSITAVPFEVRRIFAPVIEMEHHRPGKGSDNHPIF